MSVISICFSQNNVSVSKKNFYSEKIKLYTKDKEYKDTVFTFRNYIMGNDEKQIVCNGLNVDKDIEKLIWECKYLEVYLEFQNNLNKFSIVSYKIDNKKNNIIASYFLCDRESKETIEMRRFLIANKKIVGINIFPSFVKGFLPIEEYDKPHSGRID